MTDLSAYITLFALFIFMFAFVNRINEIQNSLDEMNKNMRRIRVMLEEKKE